MNHRQSQYPAGMTAEVTQIDENEQQPRGCQSGKNSNDGEIPNLIGIGAYNPRRALRQKQRQQYAQRGQYAICGNEDCAEVEEDGMHLSKDILSESRKGRIRPTGP